ncbi:MAG: 3'-5' exonuclease [Nanoarchaeota archaeon]
MKNLIFLDVETGGLDPKTDALLEIGALFVKEDKILHKYSSLILPPEDLLINKEALEINKLQELYKSGGNEKEVLSLFSDLIKRFDIQKARIAGWNVHLDIAFLKEAFKRNNLPYEFNYRLVDVQSVWFFYNTNFGNPPINISSLSNVSEFLFGKETEHRALSDITATFKIYEYLLSTIKMRFNN